MSKFRPSTTMSNEKSALMYEIADSFERIEELMKIGGVALEPRLAAVGKTQLEIAAAMINKSIAFGE